MRVADPRSVDPTPAVPRGTRALVIEDEQALAGAVADAGHFKEPIIRQFKTELTMPMRDGQTSEVTQAADPGSGRVLIITVTVNVVK